MSPTNHAVSYFYFHRLSAISFSLVSGPGLQAISTTQRLSMWSCCTLTYILNLCFACLFHFYINAGEFQSILAEPHSKGSRL